MQPWIDKYFQVKSTYVWSLRPSWEVHKLTNKFVIQGIGRMFIYDVFYPVNSIKVL